MTEPTSIPSGSVRKLVIFRALHLGDLLVAMPAIKALRVRFPEAEITLMGLPWASYFADRFRGYVDRFVEFPGYPGIDEVDCDESRSRQFLDQQRSFRYDLAVQMHGSGPASNDFVLELGADVTAGFYTGRRPAGLAPSSRYPEGLPEVMRNLELARLLGCGELDPHLEFPLNGDDRTEAARLLSPLSTRGEPRIAIHPGSKMPSRRWPPAYFADAANQLHREHGAHIVLTGGEGEEEIVEDVARAMEIEPLIVAGKTSIGSLAAVIEQMDVFISNDSGPANLAVAVDTPSVVIAGPSDPERWAPLDAARHPVIHRPTACSPCMNWECPIDHRCLRRIEPVGVVKMAADLLAAGAAA